MEVMFVLLLYMNNNLKEWMGHYENDSGEWVRDGDVWMFKYETYTEKKWLERYGIWEDPIHLRETYRRIKDEQRRKHRSRKGVRLMWAALWSNAS